MPRALPVPARFLGLAWRAVRRVPAVWLIRGGFELGAYLYRFAFFFGLGLLFVLHLAAHIQTGASLGSWAPRLITAVTQPHTIIAVAGLFIASWALLFSAESLCYAGVWSALRRATTERTARPWADAFSDAFRTFGRAVGVRLLVRLCEATLFVTIVASCLIIAQVTGFVRFWAGSSLVLPSLVCAALLMVVSVIAVVVRLTAELVASTVYLDDVGLGEGIVRAAALMLAHPVYIYRLFIVSAAVLIPPLLVGWVAALTQNVLLFADATVMASLFRLAAELAIVVGLVAFSVMMHATFFAYYAWATDRIEPEIVAKNDHPDLSDLIPDHYDYVANVDEILGPWDDRDVQAKRSSARPTARAPVPATGFDLSAILARDEEE